MRAFGKGFLIGTVCVCVLALVLLCVLRPKLTTHEADVLKTAYTQPGPGANSPGADSLPAEKEDAPALDFAALRADYPDICAWLTIPGTLVDYPVLQSSPESSEYYLRRNYKGEYRMAGSLFFQADCSPGSRCLIVYGHNMADGTMFGCLTKYLDAAYCGEHEQITLQTMDGVRQYTVAAVLETDISRVPFNRTMFENDAGFLDQAQSLLDASTVKTGVPITADSHLLVLVTCSYSWPDARVVVVAVEKGTYIQKTTTQFRKCHGVVIQKRRENFPQ